MFIITEVAIIKKKVEVIMSELNFKVDEQKCIHCGLCVQDCITSVLEYNANGTPEVKREKNCIGCQHCLSVCPVGAISIYDKNPEESQKVFNQNPDMVLNLIQSRRSIRKYKQENVSKETLQKLKDMLKWVPTGCNYHRLHFAFIEDIEIMNKFRNHVNEKVLNALTKTPVKAVSDKFGAFTQSFINGEDVIFRGAPHMVIVSNSIKAPCLPEDPIIALSYLELYAHSLGLGTCWCGLGQMCMQLFPELEKYIELPEGYRSEYVMLFGNKDINYPRTTQPENCIITEVQNKDFEEISVLNKAKHLFKNFIR